MKRVVLTIIVSLFAVSVFAADVKKADLAGSWYTADGAELEILLNRYLDGAKPDEIDGKIFAIISPHAGYQFSGPVAAYGFKAVKGRDIKTVVIIGFSHRKPFDGIAIYSAGAWQTPLGEVKIDEKLAAEIASKNPRIRFEPRLFDNENSVEMQVPFVQVTFRNAKIVPISFGAQDYNDIEIVADALAAVLKGRDDVLVIASTDLSHFHSYDEANRVDKHTIDLINDMKAKDMFDEARIGLCEMCGVMPVTSALLAAKRLGFDKARILKYANSGDTSGNKREVVGYLSAALYKESNQLSAVSLQQKQRGRGDRMLNDAQRKRLLQIARESIVGFVRDGRKKEFKEEDPVLSKPMGAFVTLHEAGELRGCIGSMIAQGPLYKTVANMAVEAATGDPRFSRLSTREIDKIDIEISVLTPLKKVSSHEEVAIPGDGVLVRSGFRSGVYLPQVATETGWNKEQFMTSLCAHKAGLSPDAWKDPATEIFTFQAEVFGEKGEKR
ncbi:MAG: AmmeMemoRadiSam system protein B [Candidatus Omnitrophota bacterium]|nr:AmmeMemoRadiSam system protein B [Candidatus Omnitrophota bacterium]